jgi:hypothetical protein
MKKRCLLLSIAVMVTGILLLSVTAASAAEDQVIKVGKKGEIMFGQDTKVGDLTLKAGDYQIQHRVDGSDHMVHFTELKGVHRNPYYQSAPNGTAHPGEVKCRLEPMSTKAKQTAVTVSTEGDVRRITRIEIKGENVAHVF